MVVARKRRDLLLSACSFWGFLSACDSWKPHAAKLLYPAVPSCSSSWIQLEVFPMLEEPAPSCPSSETSARQPQDAPCVLRVSNLGLPSEFPSVSNANFLPCSLQPKPGRWFLPLLWLWWFRVLFLRVPLLTFLHLVNYSFNELLFIKITGKISVSWLDFKASASKDLIVRSRKLSPLTKMCTK